MSQPDDFAAIADKLYDLAAHPLADLFPMIDDKELADLGDSIKRDGLLDKILICGDLILDGRNRYAAMRIAGVPYERDHFAFFGGNEADAVAIVEGKNIHRRHLNSTQRAMAATDFAKMRGLDDQMAAERFGLAVGQVAKARRVRTHAPMNLQKMAERGELGADAIDAAVSKGIDKRVLAQLKTADAVREELRKTGIIGSRSAHWSTQKCVQNLTGLLDTLGSHDPVDLKAHQVALDTALQQLITLAERASSAQFDEQAVA